MGTSSKAQTVGFRYSFDIHGALAKSIDGLLQIRASGKVAWSGNATSSQTISINAPNLFGGDKGEGGIQGQFDLMMGDEAQPLNTRLAAALGGGLVPNFRGFAGFFYSGLVTSINPYPKKWETLSYRRMAGWDGAVWYPETCAIDLAGGQVRAMNPAHILYETYTNRENGRGLDRSMLDDAAWRAAALTLFNEGFGLCIGWKRSQGTLADFRDQICEHIGAYCGPDRNTGLITLKLIRDDYDVEDLPLFDEDSGLLSIEDDETGSAVQAPSQLYVEFVDAITGKKRRARAVNPAIAQVQGGPSSETKSYPAIPTGDLAARVAQRDMRVKASNLRKYKVKLDRRAANIGPADPFRIRSLKRGIAEVVVRAGRIEDGTLVNGTITITCLQDVFGLPSSSFVVVPPSGYVPPDRTPYAPTLRRLMEVPYRELAGLIDQANLSLLDVTAAWAVSLAARPSGLSLSYSLLTRPGTSGSFTDRGTADWCPTALLVSALPASAGPNVVTVTAALDLDQVAIGQAALLDDEILRVDAINLTTGQVTLARGCADTVPAPHAAGARIWFYDGFEGADETEYTSGVTIQAKLLTNTSEGQLAEGLAVADSLALVGRQGRPYPPGRFQVGGSYYPSAIVGDVAVSFVNRNRLSQADQLIDSAFGDVTPEAGMSYEALLKRADNDLLLARETGLSPLTLSTPYEGQVKLELWALRSGLRSFQAHRHTFNHLLSPGELPVDPNTGVVWQASTTPGSNQWVDVAWSPGLSQWCAVAASGTGNRVMTSPDGINWTLRAAAAAQSWRRVIWVPELSIWVAVSDDGATGRVMTSPDGINWTLRTCPLQVWVSIAWSPALGLMVAVSSAGMMTSPDGINWTSVDSPGTASWFSIAWSPLQARFCAVAFDGAKRVMTSEDGHTWVLRDAAAANWWRSVVWADTVNLFVAVAITGTLSDRVMTSPDGINWTARTVPALNSWTSVAWSSFRRQFVAISYDGTNRVMRSP